jgi:hypothetical protein
MIDCAVLAGLLLEPSGGTRSTGWALRLLHERQLVSFYNVSHRASKIELDVVGSELTTAIVAVSNNDSAVRYTINQFS